MNNFILFYFFCNALVYINIVIFVNMMEEFMLKALFYFNVVIYMKILYFYVS